MMQQIVPFEEVAQIPVENGLNYGEAVTNKSGKGRSVLVNWKRGAGDGIRLVMQTPKMWAPFGINVYTPDDGGPPKYSVSLSFKGFEDNERLKKFHDLFQSLDYHNCTHATQKQEMWWGAGVKERNIIEDRYTTNLKPDKNGKYAPTLKLKLNFKNNQPDFRVYDEAGNQVGLDYIEGPCSIVALFEIGSLWIADKKFGQNVKILQMKVFKQTAISDYAIVDHPGDADMADAQDGTATMADFDD